MADEDLLVQQREARKKKVLENSEDRLRKVMGWKKTNKEEIDIQVKALQNHCTLHQDDSTYIQKNSFTNDFSQTSPLDNNVVNTTCETKNENEMFQPCKSSDTENEISSSHTPSVSSSVSDQSSCLNKSITEPRTSFSSGSRRKSFNRGSNITPFMRLSLCALVAVAMRFLILLNVSIVFEASVIAPFLMLELTFIIYDKLCQEEAQKPQTSNFFSALLLFSGISQTTIDWLCAVMSVLSLTFEDFCLYFFSFCMTHLLLDCSAAKKEA